MIEFSVNTSTSVAYCDNFRNSYGVRPATAAFVPKSDILRPFSYESVVGDKILEQIANLGVDWDGYGAEPIDQLVMQNSRGALLTMLKTVPLPEIYPNTNGTMTFEWESSKGVAHLELGTERYSYFLKPASGQSIFSNGMLDGLDVNVLAANVENALYPSYSFQRRTSASNIIY